MANVAGLPHFKLSYYSNRNICTLLADRVSLIYIGDILRHSICFIVTSPSTARAFLDGYLSQMKDRGWRITLICGEDSEILSFAEREGVNFRAVPLTRDPSIIKDLWALVHLTIAIRALAPSAVVYATPKASLLSAIASRINRVPVRIYEQWGLRLEGVTGPFRFVLYLFEWLTSRLSTLIVANSDSLAIRIKSLRLAKGSSVVTIGKGSSHGVDVEKFCIVNTPQLADDRTARFLAKSSGLTVGFVGRLHPDKGIDVLLEALNLCATAGVDCRALLVGADEGAQLDKWDESKVPVHFVGRVEDPRPYYREMDILVLMSKREGFPNVVLEAASMEVPAIVSNGTGAIDSVVDGRTGVVAPVGDADQLADLIIHLQANPEIVEEMGAAARARVVREFEENAVQARHIDLLASKMNSIAK